MAVKIQHVKMQSALFWTDRYRTYAMMNIGIGQMHELKFIDEVKDVGVVIDSKLKFSSHIVNQVKKVNRLMDLIRRSYNFLHIVSIKYLFISLVRPHLNIVLRFGIHN